MRGLAPGLTGFRQGASLIDNCIFQEGIRGQRIIEMRRSLFIYKDAQDESK